MGLFFLIHCLASFTVLITICCFVVMLLLAMVYNEYCYIICKKQLVMHIRSAIDIGLIFSSNNEYQISENRKNVMSGSYNLYC